MISSSEVTSFHEKSSFIYRFLGKYYVPGVLQYKTFKIIQRPEKLTGFLFLKNVQTFRKNISHIGLKLHSSYFLKLFTYTEHSRYDR